MSMKEFPEEEKNPQPREGSVDFSDLGPLFAPPEPEEQEENSGDALTSEEPESPEWISEAREENSGDVPSAEAEAVPEASPEEEEPEASDESVEFIPEEEEEVFPAGDEENTVEFTPAEEEEVPEFIPGEEEFPEGEDAGEPAPAAEAAPRPTVDFSDLGPLFSPEPHRAPDAVQPGAAALLLKRLSELPPDESCAQASQEAVEEYEGEVPEEYGEEAPGEAPDAYREKTPGEAPEECGEEAPGEAPEEYGEEIPGEDAEAYGDEVPESQESDLEESAAETAEVAAEYGEAPVPQEGESPEAEETSAEEQKSASTGILKRPTGKGRPKRKKGEGFFGIPNLLVTAVWIAVTILIGVTLGRMAWICAADVLAFGREDKPVTVTIYEADDIEDITRKLHEAGLIKYPGLFRLYASLAVDEGEIKPGIWDLNTLYDYHALVNMMSPSSSREVVELMIPEGYSCRQIFALMEENKICTSLDLGVYAASGELEDYWFLEGVPRGDMYCLEGFLFPDTYQFYKNDSPRNVLTKMLDNFQNRFDEPMIAQIDSLNAHLSDLMAEGGHDAQFIADNQLGIRDIINVASLVEKETSSADEGYVIASVIYNRLFNWDQVPYLNIDATIVYALGGKNKLTPEDLKVNSPYNTYTHTGLTPGPIANPGLSSIRAALDPASSNYYFYVLDPALGSHRFSTTYDEHKANIASIGG